MDPPTQIIDDSTQITFDSHLNSAFQYVYVMDQQHYFSKFHLYQNLNLS